MRRRLLVVTALGCLLLLQAQVAFACRATVQAARVELRNGGLAARIYVAAVMDKLGFLTPGPASVFVETTNRLMIYFALLALHRGWIFYFETDAPSCPASGDGGTLTHLETPLVE